MPWKRLSLYRPFVRGTHPSQRNPYHQRRVMRSFDVYFIVGLNNLLNRQSNCLWLEAPCRLWDVTVMNDSIPIGHIRHPVDLIHKSPNALHRYPTRQHFVTEISVAKCCILGYLCNALWDFSYGSVDRPWGDLSGVFSECILQRLS